VAGPLFALLLRESGGLGGPGSRLQLLTPILLSGLGRFDCRLLRFRLPEILRFL